MRLTSKTPWRRNDEHTLYSRNLFRRQRRVHSGVPALPWGKRSVTYPLAHGVSAHSRRRAPNPLRLRSALTESNRYHFDQTCRVLAIATAKRLGLTARLSINFLPNAVYEPASCICLTLAAAEKVGFDPTLLIFELTEEQKIENPDHVLRIITDYQARGFATAIDDFGAGYSGLNLLADYQPNLIKLDIGLVRGIDKNPVRQEIVAGIFDTAQRLGIATIAEGVETAEEYRWLRNLGITLFQGYLFAKPEVEALPQPNWQVVDETGA